MNKSMIAIGALLALSGCWWDDAPETYQGTATVSLDNGTKVVQDFACDFRAQQATRSCDLQLVLTRFTADNKPPIVNPVVINVAVSAHAREEGRYMVVVTPPFPELNWRQRSFQHDLEHWNLSTEPSARTETGLPAYIATEENLATGFDFSFVFPMGSTLSDAATAGDVELKWEPVPAASLSS